MLNGVYRRGHYAFGSYMRSLDFINDLFKEVTLTTHLSLYLKTRKDETVEGSGLREKLRHQIPVEWV